MNNKVYLVVLSGGGDTYIKIVDEETWNWITSDDMGQAPADEDESSWEDQIVPPSQIAKMKANHEKYTKKWGVNDQFYPLQITSGSWENDRALAAMPADGYDNYDSFKEAMTAIKDNGDIFEDEYEGYFY